MFKRASLVVLQTVLFLFLLTAGAFLPALPTFSSLYWQVQTAPGRVYVLDGLMLAVLVYVLIVAVEAARGRLRGSGGLTTLSLILALVLGLAMKIGFKSL